MELANAPLEEARFANVNELTRNSEQAQSGTTSAKLNSSRVLGPFKTFKVRSGDVLSAEVYAYYTTASTGSTVGLAAYISNPNNVPGGPESHKNLPLLNLGITINPAPTPPGGTPKAYLKYIFYDNEYKYVSSQTVNVGSAGAWHLLTLPQLTADRDGYVQVFVANESDKNAWFDNLKITYREALIVQENHYSPFGLNLAGIEKQGQPNDKFQYNGKEKQEEFGLNWNDYGARMYDAQLGRWHVVDPLADVITGITPYAYSYNNPLKYADPSGLIGETDIYGRDRYDSFTGMYKAPMDRPGGMSPGMAGGGESPKSDGRRRDITPDDVAASYSVNRVTYYKNEQGYYDYLVFLIAKDGSGSQLGFMYANQGLTQNAEGVDLHYWSQIARRVASSTLATSIPFQQAFKRATLYRSGGFQGWETVLVKYTKTILGKKIIDQPLFEMNAINAGRWATSLKVVSKTVGIAGIALAGYDISQRGLTTSNALDLAMSGLAVSGFGTGIASAYFLLNAGSMIITGKDLGQHLDDASEHYTGKSITSYINGR